MKGMIFAAGIGSRLKPWTDFHPKALVEVGGKPVIGHVIDKMVSNGINHIIVNVHHFASQVIDYLKTSYSQVRIDISDETSRLLDTGGGLRKALPLIGDESVIIHNADIVTDFDLSDIITYHNQHNCDITLLVQPRETARYFLFKDERLRGWTDLRSGEIRPQQLNAAECCERLAFGGVHVISPKVFNQLTDYAPIGEPFSITDFYINKCNNLDIGGFQMPPNKSWFDVGKPATLELARNFMNKNTH